MHEANQREGSKVRVVASRWGQKARKVSFEAARGSRDSKYDIRIFYPFGPFADGTV